MMRLHSIDEVPVVDEDDRLVGLIDVQDLIARGFSVLDQP
jgi:CBS domain-containing protein